MSSQNNSFDVRNPSPHQLYDIMSAKSPARRHTFIQSGSPGLNNSSLNNSFQNNSSLNHSFQYGGNIQSGNSSTGVNMPRIDSSSGTNN